MTTGWKGEFLVKLAVSRASRVLVLSRLGGGSFQRLKAVETQAAITPLVSSHRKWANPTKWVWSGVRNLDFFGPVVEERGSDPRSV